MDEESDECDLFLLDHQIEFVEDTETEYLGLCAGFGSGKTHAFVAKAISLALDNVGHNIALLEPTNSLVGLILVPKLEEVLDELGIEYTTATRPVLTYTLYFEDGETNLLLMSAENYQRHIGYEVAAFGVDEVDTIKKMIAEKMFIKLAARKRGGAPVKQGFFVSTPEGFSWMHEFFVKNEAEDNRRLIRASTYDNPFLDDDYIPGLKKIYPKNLIEAYLNGKFVNLLSNTVYDMYDRRLNDTNKTLNDNEFRRYALHIGVDFNVNNMSAVTHVMTREAVYAVDEICGGRNTKSLIESIKSRYRKRTIYIYPDSSGKSTRSNSTQTDIALLQQAFGRGAVRFPNKNPYVKDRVGSVNAMFCNGNDQRRYFINQFTCPKTADNFEQQTYNKAGEPDKAHDRDNVPDACGYFIHQKYPVKRRGSIKTR